MADGLGGVRFAVRIDSAVFDEDLAHATDAGRAAIKQTVAEIADDGVPYLWLTADTRDGTKTLLLLAAGERHPTQPWRPSVYQVAHARLEQ